MPKKPTILAVDDTPANLVALDAVLEGEFHVLFAHSGMEAIALLEARSDVDVILMDVQMPIMDGFEAAARIKKIRGCESIPIIFITAVYTEDPYIKRGYEVGGVDYVSKPFDPHLLRLKMSIYASFRQQATLLQEREKQLHETEELMKAKKNLSIMLANLPVGVLITDINGRIYQSNQDVSRICNSRNAISNDAYGGIFGWWDATGEMIEDEQGALTRTLNAGESFHNQLLQIQCADGSAKTIAGSISPLFGVDAQIIGAVIVIQDVTESQKIEEELEDRVSRLISLAVPELASEPVLNRSGP
jgi:CheY-like chemotaxis protein